MAFKHFIRDSWLNASYYSGISQLHNALAGKKRGIITFHNVLPIEKLPKEDVYNVDVTAAIFEKQLLFIKEKFNILPIQEIDNQTSKGFFLTVDDGMLNNYTTLAPILEKHDLTALFAVCPDMVDGKIPHIWRDYFFIILKQFQNKAILLPFNNYSEPYFYKNPNVAHAEMRKFVYQNKVADVYELVKEVCRNNGLEYVKNKENELRYGFMNWEQITELAEKNHIIASHTMSHRVLKFLNDDEKKYELGASKKRLEEKLGRNIDWLVYPYGGLDQIDEATIKMAQEVGYKSAFMNVKKTNLQPSNLAQSRFALPPVADSPHLYSIVSGYKNLF